MQSRLSGVLNIFGVRPGAAYSYDGAFVPDLLVYNVTFTSTYEAIEKVIIPPPLKVDRDFPPEVQAMFLSFRDCKCLGGGQNTDALGVMFLAHTEFNGVKGLVGKEYVDAHDGDKTSAIEMWPSWYSNFGFSKKLADIRFLPINGDSFEFRVSRRGVRLITMRLRVGSELPAEQVAALNANSAPVALLGVREIPNLTYTGFVERSVCISDDIMSPSQIWIADQASIEFGHLDLDPLDELKVLEVTSAVVIKTELPTAALTERRVLGTLPLEVDAE